MSISRLPALCLAALLLAAGCTPARENPAVEPRAGPSATAASLATASPLATPLASASDRSAISDAQLQQNVERIASSTKRVGTALAVAIVIRGPDGTFRRRFFNYGTIAGGSSPAVSERTIFEIASVTKVFTGIALADLAQRSVVRMSDPAQNYLPAVRMPTFGDSQITLSQLASHTSALPPAAAPGQPGLAAGWPEINAGSPISRVYDRLMQYRLPRAPGTKYEYSNVGVALLGYIEEHATGLGLDQLFRERITGPLGMPDTAVLLSPEQAARLAVGFDRSGRPSTSGSPQSGWGLGTGSLRTTTNDLATFVIANMAPASSPLGSAMRTAQEDVIVRDQPGTGSGLGWDSSTSASGRRAIHKGGSGYGFNAYIYTNGPIGLVALTNDDEGAGPIYMSLREYLASVKQ